MAPILPTKEADAAAVLEGEEYEPDYQEVHAVHDAVHDAVHAAAHAVHAAVQHRASSPAKHSTAPPQSTSCPVLPSSSLLLSCSLSRQGFPILVVAPTSVLDNWMREFDTWGTFRRAEWAWDVWRLHCVVGVMGRRGVAARRRCPLLARPHSWMPSRVCKCVGKEADRAIRGITSGQKEVMVMSYGGLL